MVFLSPGVDFLSSWCGRNVEILRSYWSYSRALGQILYLIPIIATSRIAIIYFQGERADNVLYIFSLLILCIWLLCFKQFFSLAHTNLSVFIFFEC